MSDPSALFTGKVFNGCWVIEHLIDDKGNFSNVFCARHAVTGAQVAVKVLKFGRLGQIEPLEEFEAERVLFEKLRSCFHVLTLEDSGEVEAV